MIFTDLETFIFVVVFILVALMINFLIERFNTVGVILLTLLTLLVQTIVYLIFGNDAVVAVTLVGGFVASLFVFKNEDAPKIDSQDYDK